jgi:hypothetical protein
MPMAARIYTDFLFGSLQCSFYFSLIISNLNIFLSKSVKIRAAEGICVIRVLFYARIT